MTKAEHNKILEDLWDQVNLNDFKAEIILMSHLVAKDHQIQIMEDLLMRVPLKSPEYGRLNGMVEKAVADSKKGRF